MHMKDMVKTEEEEIYDVELTVDLLKANEKLEEDVRTIDALGL